MMSSKSWNVWLAMLLTLAFRCCAAFRTGMTTLNEGVALMRRRGKCKLDQIG